MFHSCVWEITYIFTSEFCEFEYCIHRIVVGEYEWENGINPTGRPTSMLQLHICSQK